MVDSLQQAAVFAGLVAVCAGFLLVIGFPVRWWIAPSRLDRFGVETMLVGAGVFTAFAWHWSQWGSGGLRRGMPILGMLVVTAWVATFLRSAALRRAVVRLRPRAVLAALAPPLALLVVTVGLYGLHFPDIYGGDAVVPMSAGNNDLAYYGMAGGHFERHGFDDGAHVVGLDLGGEAKVDVPGAFMFIGGVGAATGIDTWRLGMPVLAFGLFLLLAALAALARRVGACAPAVAVAIASLAVLSATFFYNMIHGFVAYGLTVAPVAFLAVLVMDLVDAQRAADRRAPLLIGGLATTWIYAVYPHVAFYFVPVLGVLVVVTSLGRSSDVPELLRSIAGGAVGLVGLFLLPLALIPQRVVISVQRTAALQEVTAGWALGRVRPGQWLGVARFPDEPVGVKVADLAGWDLVVVIAVVTLAIGIAFAAIAALTVRLRPGPDRSRWLAVLCLTALPVGMYELMYARYGEMYQAWKAMTYVQPMVVTVVLVAVWQLLVLATGRHGAFRAAAGVAGAACFVVVTLAAARPTENTFPLRLTPEHRELAGLGERLGIDSINVDVRGPLTIWDTWWVLHMLHDLRVYSTSPAYVVTTPPGSPWTVRRVESQVPAGATRHPFNKLFALDFQPL